MWNQQAALLLSDINTKELKDFQSWHLKQEMQCIQWHFSLLLWSNPTVITHLVNKEQELWKKQSKLYAAPIFMK